MESSWDTFKESLFEMFTATFGQLRDYGIEFLPKIALGVVILLAGWGAAILVRKVITKIVRALGLDVFTSKLGLRRFLEDREIRYPPSALLGWTIYWMIQLTALTIAFEEMGLTTASEYIQNALYYIPRLVVAVVLLGVGVFMSGLVGSFVDRLARVAHVPFHFVLGQAARYTLIGLAVANTLDYLHLASPEILLFGLTLVVVLGVVVLLVFLVCGQNLVASMLAQRFLMESISSGDQLTSADVSGTVRRIGIIDTELEVGSTLVYVPNRLLLEQIRELQPRQSDDPGAAI